MTRLPVAWLHRDRPTPDDSLWDPKTATFVPRPHFWTRVAYTLIAWFAGLLLGFLIAQHVLAATLPETSEAFVMSASAGGGSSAASLVPGAPLEAASSAAVDSVESVGVRPRAAPPLDGPYSRGRTGIIAFATIGGPNYLAIPIGPGHRVRICAATCLILTSTDAGPNSERLRAGRIADVALGHWRQICGLTAARGICAGSWTVVGPGSLPATDR